MPVRRDTQGKIVDEPTRRVSQPDQKPAGTRRAVDITGKPETAPTAPVGGSPLAGGRYDVPTTRIRDERPQPAPDADRTRLIRPGKGSTDQELSAGDPMDERWRRNGIGHSGYQGEEGLLRTMDELRKEWGL